MHMAHRVWRTDSAPGHTRSIVECRVITQRVCDCSRIAGLLANWTLTAAFGDGTQDMGLPLRCAWARTAIRNRVQARIADKESCLVSADLNVTAITFKLCAEIAGG